MNKYCIAETLCLFSQKHSGLCQNFIPTLQKICLLAPLVGLKKKMPSYKVKKFAQQLNYHSKFIFKYSISSHLRPVKIPQVFQNKVMT